MGNIETKKTLPQPPARLKNIEIYGDSQKSDKALYGKETFMKGYYILDNCHFVAIYDGHGYYGGSAAHDANEILMGYFEENRKVLNELSSDKEVKDFILDGFRQIQQKLSQNVIYHKSGTCCIGVLILENKLYIINIGNSRAVLCTKTASGLKAVELSKDHVLSCSEERERVAKRGLKIHKVQEKGKEYGVERLWIDKEGPGITATRTLGDAQLSKIITSEPEIEEYELNPSDSFLILGSDGLWDVMNSEDAVIMLTQEKKGKEAVETLVRNAKKRWRDRVQNENYVIGDDPQDIGKTDDVTAVVCYFNFPSEEEMEVLGRFNFLFENKHARLRELKQSLEKK